jgi:hypothetical protein
LYKAERPSQQVRTKLLQSISNELVFPAANTFWSNEWIEPGEVFKLGKQIFDIGYKSLAWVRCY